MLAFLFEWLDPHEYTRLRIIYLRLRVNVIKLALVVELCSGIFSGGFAMIRLVMFLLVLCAAPCYGQTHRGRLSTNSYSLYGMRNAYATNPPKLYSGGKYLGELSSDPYRLDSVSNPYGRYGSPYSLDSVNNPYSRYGQYRTQPVYVYPRW